MVETSVYLTEDLLSRLDSLAQKRHTDRSTLLSAALVAYLEQNATVKSEREELLALAGTWSKEEGDEFDEAVKPFAQVDDALWHWVNQYRGDEKCR